MSDAWRLSNSGEEIETVTGKEVCILANYNEANARLIVAAPDLLEACKLSLKFYYQLYSPDDNREPAASLKAAIAKATKGNEP